MQITARLTVALDPLLVLALGPVDTLGAIEAAIKGRMEMLLDGLVADVVAVNADVDASANGPAGLRRRLAQNGGRETGGFRLPVCNLSDERTG
jgi:hypothetical protein